MKNAEIMKKAENYLAMESHEYFISDVKECIDSGDNDGLSDRFYTDLDFGTGGLRGIIGGGTNRMNPLNVRKATRATATTSSLTLPGKPFLL